MNTHKTRALFSGFLSGLIGFWNWLATVPPEQQQGWLASLVELTPVQWRPNVGLATRFLMWALMIYAVHQSSKSGPQSKPKNDPDH